MRIVVIALVVVASGCGFSTPDGPAIDTPSFMSAMETEGYEVRAAGGTGEEAAFGEPGQWIFLNSRGVIAVEFPSEDALEAGMKGLRIVPGAYRTDLGTVDLTPSTSHPRFYAQGRELIIDPASNEALSAALERVMGPPLTIGR